ncbi:hypothetical protein Tco_1343758 [Tanacetum coccineum]
MESLNSNSKERELQLTQRLVKQRHSHCMAWFEQLETHLRDLYLNSSSHAVDAFKPAFHSLFGEEHQTFRLKMFHNLDQLRLQLERENLLEVNPRTCLDALRTQFKEFFTSKRVNSSEHLHQCWQKDFKEYTFCEPDTYRRDLLENLDTLEAVIHRVVITYGKSTAGSAQFLGDKLVSWSSKKQTSTSISSIEAEYIALFGCCAQILWMRFQLSDYGFVTIASLFTMADENINAPEVPTVATSPPTRSDEQILPHNCGHLGEHQLRQSFHSSPLHNFPSIYIQQFWDTIRFDKDKGTNCQLDEQRFYLSKAIFRDALQLPQDNNNFTSPFTKC